jgi:hypothetical protein
MSKQLRALVILSDLHVGSTVSLMRPGFVTEEGQEICQTPIARWFWDCWQLGHAWLSGIVDPKDYALVLNGDLIEGNHHRTTQIWSPEKRDHVTAAKDIIAPVARRAGKTFLVRGTECHVNGSETSVAEAIGAERNPEHGYPYWDRLMLNVAGVAVSVRHHFPATARSYLEGSQHSIQLGNARIEASRAGDIVPRVLVGAHRHRTGHFCDGNGLTVVTGAWQGLTRHGFKLVPDGRPCPSIYVLDWRDKEDGELPAVHFRHFNPPPSAAVTI